MSRGTETARMDEAYATYAIGEAIILIAIELWHNKPNDHTTYESARADAAERMAFALRDMVLNWSKQ